jgi:hypothetical protein
MRLKSYLNETESIKKFITYELYCESFNTDDEDLDILIEKYLNENAGEEAKKRGLVSIGFGRYVKKDNPDKVVAISKDGELVDFEHSEEEHDEVGGEKGKVDVKNILVKMKKHVDGIAKDLSISKDHVVEAFKQPSVYDTVKHFGFSIKSMAKATQKTIATLNVSLQSTFEEMHKTKTLQKLKSGAIKVDEFLDRNPTLKKITGPAVGGFMVYQWLHMSFSGDVHDDYDLSNLPKALKGEYGMKDLLGTPSGLKGMAQLAIGVATGGLPIWIGGAKGLTMALAYSGARLAKNNEVAGKLKDKMKSMFKKKDEK